MTPDHSEARVTVWMSEEFTERVDERVDWRHGSRSQWVREAVQWRMLLAAELDRQGLTLPADEDARDRALRDIALAGVDAAADDLLSETELAELQPDE
jgi:Arc/MetJ-type ribon-helix-helix transcriptional regulator